MTFISSSLPGIERTQNGLKESSAESMFLYDASMSLNSDLDLPSKLSAKVASSNFQTTLAVPDSLKFIF